MLNKIVEFCAKHTNLNYHMFAFRSVQYFMPVDNNSGHHDVLEYTAE